MISIKKISISRQKQHKNNKKAIANVLSKTVLIIFAAIILVPFWIILISSFKTPAEIISAKFSWFPKDGFDFTSYKNAFNWSLAKYTSNVIKGLTNTLLYVVPNTFIGVIMSGLSAYAFAKINFKGKEVLFSILLLTMVMPGTVVLIPQYFIYSAIGWIRTPLPLIIPGLFGGAGTVFFMRQFMRGVPTELVEAAEVDGLGKFKTFWQIMLPVSIPAFIAQFVLHFISGYNDYLAPIMFLSGAPKYYTLQVVLKNLASTQEAAIQSMMANAVIAILPLIIIYLCLQNFIIDGIAVSAVKG